MQHPWQPKKPEPEPKEEAEVEVEIDPEHVWRCQMLVEAGFTDFQAFRLSIGGADWHDAKKLFDAGCDPDRIVDILT